MLRHLLRRRARSPRTSLVTALPRAHHPERPARWRRSLAWAALLTLVASALYFSLVDHDVGKPAPAVVP